MRKITLCCFVVLLLAKDAVRKSKVTGGAVGARNREKGTTPGAGGTLPWDRLRKRSRSLTAEIYAPRRENRKEETGEKGRKVNEEKDKDGCLREDDKVSKKSPPSNNAQQTTN